MQINDIFFYPQSAMLPLAAAFFLVIAYKRLHPRIAASRVDAYLAVTAVGIAALAGSWLWADRGDPDSVVAAQASLGAYWGAFAGIAVWALLRRSHPLRAANAIAPAVMAGGAVARLGCVFAGCCRGYGALFGPWPLYDIAALLVALAVGYRLEKRRHDGALLAFLIGYGLLRFVLEFARPAPAYAFGLTSSQLLALAQAGAGLALLVASSAQSAAAENENS